MNPSTKRKLVYMGCAILALLITFLQAHSQSKPAVGIKGGLNISNFYVDDIDDQSARLGFHAGLYGQLFSTSSFALQPELTFSTRGTEVISDGLFDQKTRFNLQYLDVPVLAVFKLGPAAELHAGMYGGYLVGANIKSDGDLGDYFNELDRDNFESFDYGFVGGLGFNFGNVQVGARYNLGLAEIAKSEGARTLLGNSKNSLGQLYMAIRMND